MRCDPCLIKSDVFASVLPTSTTFLSLSKWVVPLGSLLIDTLVFKTPSNSMKSIWGHLKHHEPLNYRSNRASKVQEYWISNIKIKMQFKLTHATSSPLDESRSYSFAQKFIPAAFFYHFYFHPTMDSNIHEVISKSGFFIATLIQFRQT